MSRKKSDRWIGDIIQFHKTNISIDETLVHVSRALQYGRISGDGPYTQKCTEILEAMHGWGLLVHSGTAALEMAALLAGIVQGDEVIMPSYTFSSTANAVVLRGGVPVFIDVLPGTLNINYEQIGEAVTERTKAVMVVHYAGAACEMDEILNCCSDHGLICIEDAAQSLGGTYKGRQVGSLGDFSATSFHETKNFTSGEGGFFYAKNPTDRRKAEILREKGTDRSSFLRGEVNKYQWKDVGSSYLPSDILAAILFPQLQKIDHLIASRVQTWAHYHHVLSGSDLVRSGLLTLPQIPEYVGHNGHIYWMLCNSERVRDQFIAFAKDQSVFCTSHYEPLHSSEAGRRFGRTGSDLAVTDSIYSRIIRLPIYNEMPKEYSDRILNVITDFNGWSD